jgi:hypothetical protein
MRRPRAGATLSGMEPSAARNIAHYSHVDARDRFDELVIEHLERVAAHVPAGARSVAYLHDVLEQTETPLSELRAEGLTDLELRALELLTRAPVESFELYALRIAYAPGPEGELARVVKLADLEDHLAHAHIPAGAPPYAWARRHIANGQTRDRRAASRAA